MHYSVVTAFVAICATSPTALVAAQTPRNIDAWEKRAWADGKIDDRERQQLNALDHKAWLAVAKEYVTEKFPQKKLEAAFSNKTQQMQAQKQSWVPITPNKANREVEPQERKEKWQHSALVDYNRDGIMDTARLSYYGNKMAVVIYFKDPTKRPFVASTFRLRPDVEIYGAGTRIMVIWPDLGHQVLLLHRGQPSIVNVFSD